MSPVAAATISLDAIGNYAQGLHGAAYALRAIVERPETFAESQAGGEAPGALHWLADQLDHAAERLTTLSGRAASALAPVAGGAEVQA